MNRPLTPRYTAADILILDGKSKNPYPGGFKRYRHDKKAHIAYALWHIWATRGRCRHCDGTILENLRHISTG